MINFTETDCFHQPTLIPRLDYLGKHTIISINWKPKYLYYLIKFGIIAKILSCSRKVSHIFFSFPDVSGKKLLKVRFGKDFKLSFPLGIRLWNV